jgi:S-formylglutathione hydrolase FrmB
MSAYTPLLELKENPPPIGYSLLKDDNIMEMAYMLTREHARAPVVKTESDIKLHYDFVANELPQRIEEIFKVSTKREDKYIAGLSMGGYGALKIALKETDIFCAAAGLSSAADIKTELFKGHLSGILNGKTNVIEDDDLYNLVKKKENDVNKPRLYMWCGTEDFLYEDNIKFKEYMKNFNYDFTYRESEGNHSWEYWDTQIVEVIKWMLNDNKN